MPTYNRRAFVPHAIRYFLRQDYEPKELIIVDDGSDPVEDLIPDAENIHYLRLGRKITLGAKLNLACEQARGDIIANWDDDDWYAERRLRYQVEALLQPGTDVCGLNNLLYLDLRSKQGFRYAYPPNQKIWLLGSSLCFKKELWKGNRFAEINVGMDGLFVWAALPDRVKALEDATFSVHMIHDSNISPKKTEGSWWQAYPLESLKEIMGDDWKYYSNGSGNNGAVQQTVFSRKTGADLQVLANGQTPPVFVPQPDKNTEQRRNNGREQAKMPPSLLDAPVKPLQNVYACLVHERQDCIIDLIRNLHYHDPSSIILLYNGSQNPGLLPAQFPFGQFSAVVYPTARPQKHGYLHHFALDCMAFALENFAFDTFTIVDSDQLCIRSGYSRYLSEFFASSPRAGMLSSSPERVTRDDKINHVALQAYKEYALWKPLLDYFPGGEQKFVHWTFWPSSVFTRDAVTSLLELLRENKLARDIIERTKIWATEEVVFPTLVRLLGYEIAQNPCSYDFVKYRIAFRLQDIKRAMQKKEAYWVHPIKRKYGDPLRRYIRGRFNDYADGDQAPGRHNGVSFDSFPVLPLIKKIQKIEGWLNDQEANLLVTSTLNMFRHLPPPYNIVEIGSYHGKSTILFGSLAKELCPRAKVFAIDPHDGKLGAAGQGLQTFPPSYEKFKANIENAGLAEFVEIIRDHSYNVKWEKPVSFLFIDGLHDYANVARDFGHFSKWVRLGGYVAFHDYADYFPGVVTFVDELLQTGAYRKIYKAYSLVVLQKSDIQW
ncbi:MAG: glycosyltransferase [Lewinellaceae bacterium]|nr:glycosyltransferase [Lewinellaceae bacterium]